MTAAPMRRLAQFTLLVAAMVICASAFARSAPEAQALAERGVAHIAAVGRERAFADFTRTDGGFVDGDLYLFCLDVRGVILAHGGNPRMVGINMTDLFGPDLALSATAIDRLGPVGATRWVHFRWPNPLTKRVEAKASYIVKVDDHTVCGSGYYGGAAP